MTVAQVVKKTLSFIKAKAHCRFQTSMPPDLYLSRNNPANQITHSHYSTTNLIKFFRLQLGIPSGIFPVGFMSNSLYDSHLSDPSGIPCPPQPPLLTSLIIILWRVQIIKTLTLKFSPVPRKFQEQNTWS